MPPLFSSYVELLTFVSAELLCLLTNNNELQIIFKKNSQRTPAERKQVERGLTRAVVLQLILFVPISAVLALLLVRPLLWIPLSRVAVLSEPLTFYTLLGVVSYGFPYATIRRVVTRIALETLRQFATIAHEGAGEQD